MMLGMPTWLLEKLRTPPKAGAGIHGWLFSTARQLHAHMTPQQAVEALRIATMRCTRAVSVREITDAVTNSQSCAWESKDVWDIDPDVLPAEVKGHDVDHTLARATNLWPKPCVVQRQTALRHGQEEVHAVADLWERSLRALSMYTAENFLKILLEEMLWMDDPLVCVAREHPRDARTLPLSEHKDLSGCSFVVPSPMVKPLGSRKDGKSSPRCLDNTGPRAYLVIEFDDLDGKDVHASLLWALHRCAVSTGGPPLVCVVDSAGKSLHGWFQVGGRSESELREFMAYAILLGADPATWTRCQLVRMPNGTRGEARQQVRFFSIFSHN